MHIGSGALNGITRESVERGIIGEEMNKISKITTRSTLASAYIEEQKTGDKAGGIVWLL